MGVRGRRDWGRRVERPGTAMSAARAQSALSDERRDGVADGRPGRRGWLGTDIRLEVADSPHWRPGQRRPPPFS